MANVLPSGVASAERVFELLDEDEESVKPAPSAGPVFGRGRLVFEYVSFSYSLEKPLISGLSLVAEPGQTVAVVGPTGAGKTINRQYILWRLSITGRHKLRPSRQFNLSIGRDEAACLNA